MKTVPLFALATAVLLLTGCSKDLQRTNRIHGTWEVRRIEHFSPDGTPVSSVAPQGVMQFDKCDIRPDDFRAYRHNYSYASGDSTITTKASGTYKFDDQGHQLVVRIAQEHAHTDLTYQMVRFEKKELVLEDRTADDSRVVYHLKRKL